MTIAARIEWVGVQKWFLERFHLWWTEPGYLTKLLIKSVSDINMNSYTKYNRIKTPIFYMVSMVYRLFRLDFAFHQDILFSLRLPCTTLNSKKLWHFINASSFHQFKCRICVNINTNCCLLSPENKMHWTFALLLLLFCFFDFERIAQMVAGWNVIITGVFGRRRRQQNLLEAI